MVEMEIDSEKPFMMICVCDYIRPSVDAKRRTFGDNCKCKINLEDKETGRVEYTGIDIPISEVDLQESSIHRDWDWIPSDQRDPTDEVMDRFW